MSFSKIVTNLGLAAMLPTLFEASPNGGLYFKDRTICDEEYTFKTMYKIGKNDHYQIFPVNDTLEKVLMRLVVSPDGIPCGEMTLERGKELSVETLVPIFLLDIEVRYSQDGRGNLVDNYGFYNRTKILRQYYINNIIKDE